MNGDISTTISLCETLVAQVDQWPLSQGTPVDVAIFPPYVSLTTARDALSGSRILLGAQNLHEAKSGAFTGEISASMLLTAGCQMVILGHSERRWIFGETSEMVNRKVRTALNVGLKPIVCVGERLEEREADETHAVIKNQLSGSLQGINERQLANLTIAYEPVWAIGTGRVATVAQAGDVHRLIRDWVAAQYSAVSATELRILYGGSVKPDNAEELLADPDIDGALVGGASLDAEQFGAIIRAAVV